MAHFSTKDFYQQLPNHLEIRSIEYSFIYNLSHILLLNQENVDSPKNIILTQVSKSSRDQRPPGVTLISAPAGFGKTTLVSEWVTSRDWPAAWLLPDDGDRNTSWSFISIALLLSLLHVLLPICEKVGE
jgi:hypothetical protein